MAYNLGNFLRRSALPKPVRHWSLMTLREKQIKIGEGDASLEVRNVKTGDPAAGSRRRNARLETG